MDQVSFSFPTSTLLEIKATPLPFSCQGDDRLTWHLSSNGEFKLREAYKLALDKEENLNRTLFPGTWVWKILSLPKVKHFLWQYCHSSIAVRAILNERGLGISPVCPFCNADPETIVHALRDCPKARCFWNSLLPPMPPNLFFGMPLVEWLKINCRSSQISAISKMSGERFFLWLYRFFGCTKIVLSLVEQVRNVIF